VSTSLAPDITQPSVPLILRGVSWLMLGRLYCSMNMELILRTTILVSDIIQVENIHCAGTEIYIMTIYYAPDCGGVC
jgi:hypothetical protein